MTSFRLNKPAFGRVVLSSARMKAEMKRRASLVRAQAIATAPVYSGTYKKSFPPVEVGVRAVPPFRTKRAYARVANTARHALHVEYGAQRTPRHRTLGKALDAAKG